MDESMVREIVENNLDRLTKMLGLHDWKITIDYNSLTDDSLKGICDALIDQEEALIILDPAVLQDEKEVIEVLTHELIHCIVAAFHTYKFTVGCFLTDKERDAVNVVFCHAEERVTCDLVRILEGVENDN